MLLGTIGASLLGNPLTEEYIEQVKIKVKVNE